MTRPTRHLVIDGFLDAGLHTRILDFAIAGEADFAATQVRTHGRGQYNERQRQSLAFEGDWQEIKDAFATAILNRSGELFDALAVPAFPVSRCELEMSAHRGGHFFGTHQDTFTGVDRSSVMSDRIVSAVCYFHALPKAFAGGELALYPFSREPPALIEPDDNRLVAFPSFALHEVRPVQLAADTSFAASRFAINCWLHRARD